MATPCIGGRKLLQRSRQRVRIEHVDMKDVDEGTLADQPIRRALDLFGQVRHETVAAGRQNEGEAETLVARQARRGWIGAVTEPQPRPPRPARWSFRAPPRAG